MQVPSKALRIQGKPAQAEVNFAEAKISMKHIALPPNNNMELTGRNRHVPCKEKSKGHADFALQLM
jgi:hypothetical protein